MIEPVGPFQRCVFHGFQMPPGTATLNHFGLVESDNRFRQRVVVRVADAAHRGLSLRFGQAFAVAYRQILATITMMHHTLGSRARPQRLLQCVQNQFRAHRTRHAPADDAPREHIDDQGDVDKTSPRRDVGKVCYPQLIGTTRLELALDQIERSFSALVSNGRATFTP